MMNKIWKKVSIPFKKIKEINFDISFFYSINLMRFISLDFTIQINQ